MITLFFVYKKSDFSFKLKIFCVFAVFITIVESYCILILKIALHDDILSWYTEGIYCITLESDPFIVITYCKQDIKIYIDGMIEKCPVIASDNANKKNLNNRFMQHVDH